MLVDTRPQGVLIIKVPSFDKYPSYKKNCEARIKWIRKRFILSNIHDPMDMEYLICGELRITRMFARTYFEESTYTEGLNRFLR